MNSRVLAFVLSMLLLVTEAWGQKNKVITWENFEIDMDAREGCQPVFILKWYSKETDGSFAEYPEVWRKGMMIGTGKRLKVTELQGVDQDGIQKPGAVVVATIIDTKTGKTYDFRSDQRNAQSSQTERRPGGSKQQVQADVPLDIVKRFYGEFKALEVRHDIEEKTIGKFRPLMTESLNQEFTASQKAMAAWWEAENKHRAAVAKAKVEEGELLEGDHKPPFVDSPIFSGTYESGEVESYGDPTMAGGRAYIPVKVIDKTSQPSVNWVDIVVLHQTKDGWRIDDILYFIEGGHPRSSLRSGIDSKDIHP